MDEFERKIFLELQAWQAEMLRGPGLLGRATRRVQRKINSYVPDKVHTTLTTLIKQMIEGVLTGSKYIGLKPLNGVTLAEREAQVRRRIATYQRTASIEGGITGAGGILLGLADFPLLLTIKLKLLFDIAAEIRALDVGEQQRRTAGRDHAAMNLRRLEMRIDLRFDRDEAVVTAKLVEKCT